MILTTVISLSLTNPAQRKTCFPRVFYFPLVPWCTLGHASFLCALLYSLPPVEQCSSLLDIQSLIICWPLSRTLAIWNTLYLMIIWDVRCGQPWSGSTVSTTYTWCVFPVAMRHSPWSISLAPWVLLWLTNSTCQRACWVKGREGAMFPATEKNWLAQMGLRPLTLVSLALSTTSHSHMTAMAPAKCRNPVSIQKGKYKPQTTRRHPHGDRSVSKPRRKWTWDLCPILISMTPPRRKGNLRPASHRPSKLALKAENHFEGHQIARECKSSHEQKEKHSSYFNKNRESIETTFLSSLNTTQQIPLTGGTHIHHEEEGMGK